MWEVKTDTGSRSWINTYNWSSTGSTTNGGVAGISNNGYDTQSYVAAVNTANLCNHADWRMPSIRELHTLLLYDGSDPAIDSSYFPYLSTSLVWSGSTYAQDPSMAFGVSFYSGPSASIYYKLNRAAMAGVMLVSGAQF